ncbi:Uncharacterised protein [uncultured archaeon]|nr:Uncharacterised protein [uncultured archaeon]
MKKALSPAMWLIIAIVVALVVALVVITIVNKTANNAGDKGTSIMDIFGDSLQNQACKDACDKCKQAADSCVKSLPEKCKCT